MRRLPVYLLLDTSGSMRGEPIEAVKVGLEAMISSLRQDPYVLESAYISIIAFDKEAKLVMPLTDLGTFVMPAIATPTSGPSHLGKALEFLCQRVDAEVVRPTPERKGDWKPHLFIMTDGRPSDLMKYRQMISEVKKRNFWRIIGCAVGPKAKQSHLEELVTDMVSLDVMVSEDFLSQIFTWVGYALDPSIESMETSTPDDLPPPPEIHIVV